jgi:hypothetical protein
VGPALRAVARTTSRTRKEAPSASKDEVKVLAQEEAIRVIKARVRRRRTNLDRAALLSAGDIQATKNNCLYVGHDRNGRPTVPVRVATRPFAKAYLAALDNRLHFYTFLVLGNVKKGVLELDDTDRRLIADAWRTFAARFRPRRHR